jgi:hypothetical protein
MDMKTRKCVQKRGTRLDMTTNPGRGVYAASRTDWEGLQKY